MDHFKGKQFKKDVIIVAVGYYLRYNLSYREVQELLYDRGINVCHTTTPPLSAECQIEILQGLRLTLSRGLPLRLLSDILATFLRKNVFFIYIMITIDI